MKGYYLFAPVEPGNAGPESGVERKVRSQCKALNEYVECELVILPPVTYTGTKAEKIIRRLPYTAAWRKWKYNGEFDDGDFLYIRQVYHDYSFYRYIKEIRKRNPDMKIIYEVPTYPYDKEAKITLSTLSFTLKERVNRTKLAKYLDRIVTFYGQKEIWGVPCINLINGYDFSQVELPVRTRTDTVHVISVALTAVWHGYDRFLKGLADYYNSNDGTENIIYHYVGTVIPEHKRFVKENNLSEHVIFHGKMSGEPLKELMKECFIGIDVLGGHRKDYPISSSLKSREYCAYGIPMITSSPIDFLPKDSAYQFIVPYDDSPVDIKEILKYYRSLYDGRDCNKVAAEIREYAQERSDMSTTMKIITDLIENGWDDGKY